MTDKENTPACTMATDICEIRDQIDHIDDTILDLINRRLRPEEFRAAVHSAKEAGLSRLDSRERPRIVFGF